MVNNGSDWSGQRRALFVPVRITSFRLSRNNPNLNHNVIAGSHWDSSIPNAHAYDFQPKDIPYC